MISYQCRECLSTLRTEQSAAGRSEVCPVCGTTNTVPLRSRPINTPRRRAPKQNSYVTPIIACSAVSAVVALIGFCLYLNSTQEHPERTMTDAGERAALRKRGEYTRKHTRKRTHSKRPRERVLFSVDANELARLDRQEDRRKAMDLALQALTDEQWQDGLAILDKLGPPTKHRSSYYYWVGYACSGCKLDDRAVKEYLKAVREDERNDSAILQLGLAYGRLGWIKKAERWLARGMELCPDDPHFDFAHGHMYAGNGYYEKAREWFQRASKRGGTGPIGARARSRIREINRKLGID